MKTQRLKALALSIIVLLACSCSLSTYYFAPQEMKQTSGREVVVILKDGTTLDLINANLIGDKLFCTLTNNEKKELDIASIQSVSVTKKDNNLPFLYAGVGAIEIILGIGAATAPSPPGSCPFIFSFDGRGYVFDAEPYGGAICRGLKRTDWCELEHLATVDNRYRLLVSNELEEIENIDELKLLVVDHLEGVKVAVEPNGKIRTFARPVPPRSAADDQGRDLAALLATDDGQSWRPSYEDKAIHGSADLKGEAILEFPKPREAKTAKLLVHAGTTFSGSQAAEGFLKLFGRGISAWYDEVNGFGPAYYRVMSWYAREELYLLHIRVETEHGWEQRGLLYGGGPFMTENKAYTLDVHDVPGDVLRIKLTPPLNFWTFDSFAVDYSEDAPVSTVELAPVQALDRAGRDVREDLVLNDNRYLVLPRIGDSAELVFDAPPQAQGTVRTIFIKASGYYDIQLDGQGEPQSALIDKIFIVPGTALRNTYEAYLRAQELRNKETLKR
ncbi:MAG: hypothetical protein NTU60_07165 [Candidatus Aminicenantes bacterium]|nr:hypothetical protein [Candidatus Aminicenantes bacterium]